MDGLKKEFGTMTLVLIPVAIAINIVVGTLIANLGVPLYMDSIGTVLVAVLVGPWAGAVTGFLANVVWTATGLFTPAIAWAGVAAVIGVLAAVFKRSGWMEGIGKSALAGLITGLVAAVLSAPIAAYVSGGVTGAGTDALVAMFGSFGLDILSANFSQGVISDPLDKLVTFVVVWALMRGLPQTLKDRFSSE